MKKVIQKLWEVEEMENVIMGLNVVQIQDAVILTRQKVSAGGHFHIVVR
jgi:mRNA degradation ribonuclease J1/J2